MSQVRRKQNERLPHCRGKNALGRKIQMPNSTIRYHRKTRLHREKLSKFVRREHDFFHIYDCGMSVDVDGTGRCGDVGAFGTAQHGIENTQTQPNTTQPSPAQPSPAQPSPAQHSTLHSLQYNARVWIKTLFGRSHS